MTGAKIRAGFSGSPFSGPISIDGSSFTATGNFGYKVHAADDGSDDDDILGGVFISGWYASMDDVTIDVAQGDLYLPVGGSTRCAARP